MQIMSSRSAEILHQLVRHDRLALYIGYKLRSNFRANG